MAKRGKKNCDEALILALAAGGSVPYAAQQAGCSESTVRRRLEEPGFRSRISETRSELVSAAVGRLAVIGRKAVDVLNQLMDHADAKIRLGASRSVVNYMLHGHGNEVLSQEVAGLRDQIEALEHGCTGGAESD